MSDRIHLDATYHSTYFLKPPELMLLHQHLGIFFQTSLTQLGKTRRVNLRSIKERMHLGGIVHRRRQRRPVTSHSCKLL